MAKAFNSYIPKNTPIDRMHPMVKLYAVVCLGTSALIFPHYLFSYALVVMLFLVAARARIFARFARFMLKFTIPILVMLLFIQGLYSPKNVTVIADLGFAQLGLEGVRYALKIVGTLLVFLGTFYLMTATTYTGKLVAALIESGLSIKAGYLVLASLNIVPQMLRRMSIIQEAQSSRGVEAGGGLLSRFKAYVPLLGPVVMSSLTDAQERGMTLETRGFGKTGGKPTTYVEVTELPSDRVIKVLLVVFLILTIVSTVGLKFFKVGVA